MTPRQKQELLVGLERSKILHRLRGNELSMRCPKCGPTHDNDRQTLSINVVSDLWNCFRCESSFRGRKLQVPRLLDALGLDSLIPVFSEDEVVIEDDSLNKLRQRLLYDDKVEKEYSPIVTLPDGYRKDWEGTNIGMMLRKYLSENRNLSDRCIRKYEIGYSIEGKYAGGVILPLFMKGKLRFWQVRRVLLRGGAPKYDSPPIDKSVLYGYDDIDKRHVIVVEGMFDKLAVGESSVAVLGKSITDEQISLLAKKSVSRVTVVLDGEAWPESVKMARLVFDKLWTARIVRAIRLPYGKDPGQLGRTGLDNPLDTLTLRR